MRRAPDVNFLGHQPRSPSRRGLLSKVTRASVMARSVIFAEVAATQGAKACNRKNSQS